MVQRDDRPDASKGGAGGVMRMEVSIRYPLIPVVVDPRR
jgi:hypothetical protein